MSRTPTRRIVLSLTLLVGAGLARAGGDGDETKRSQLMQKANQILKQIAEDVTGVEGDSDARDVEHAGKQVEELEDVLDDLKDVAGDDDTIKDIANHWPGYARDFLTSLQALQRLKVTQHYLDEAEKDCRKDEDDLQRLIRDYVGHKKTASKGVAAITKMAEGHGATYKKKLEATDNLIELRKGQYETVVDFDASEGRWSPVHDGLHRSGLELRKFTDEKAKAAHQACDNLARGVEHPDVTRALKELDSDRSTTDRAFDDIKKDYKDWKEMKNGYVREYRQDILKIREAICTSDEQEIEYRVESETKAVSSALNALYGTLMGRADLMLKQLDKVEGDDAMDEQVARLTKNIKAAQRRLEDAAKDGLLQGYNNPRIRTALEYGKKMHEQMQKDCDYAEVEIDGGSGRIDCVDVSSGTCRIIEIKPNNSNAKSKASDQLDRYRRWLESHTKSDLNSNGKALLECVDDNGKFKISDYVVRTYDFCPPEDTLAPKLDDRDDD